MHALELSKLSNIDSVIADFKEICKVDLGLKEGSIYNHLSNIRRYLEHCKKANLNPEDASSIRAFLSPLKEGNQNTYGNKVKAIRVFFREYLKSDAAKGFKVPQPNMGYVKVPSKAELKMFYDGLPSWKEKALFSCGHLVVGEGMSCFT